MSEFNLEKNERAQAILNYSLELIEKGPKKEIYQKYADKLKNVIPLDVVIAFDKLVHLITDMEIIKSTVSKVLNILYNPLINFEDYKISDDPLLHYLIEDNNTLKAKLLDGKNIIKDVLIEKKKDNMHKLKTLIKELSGFIPHYVIKENILFPIIEKQFPYYGCLQIMWSIHDDVRKNLKNLQWEINNDNQNLDRINDLIGKLYFDMNALIFRENKILFPVAAAYIDDKLLKESVKEALEIGFPYAKVKIKEDADNNGKISFFNHKIILSTGELTVKQIELIFNHLPVDITFVDENDTVRYFSAPKDRIFVRTKSVIGRKVQNCHPKESVDIVNKIIKAFKQGEKDKASFWIKMGEKYVLIQYFAIKDENGKYCGLIEVSQDIADIQKITGEKRLLDWE